MRGKKEKKKRKWTLCNMFGVYEGLIYAGQPFLLTKVFRAKSIIQMS